MRPSGYFQSCIVPRYFPLVRGSEVFSVPARRPITGITSIGLFVPVTLTWTSSVAAGSGSMAVARSIHPSRSNVCACAAPDALSWTKTR